MDDANRYQIYRSSLTDIDMSSAGFNYTSVVLASDYDALRAELNAAKKDAERYRLLRVRRNDPAGIRAVTRTNVRGFDFSKHKWDDLYGQELDDVIDAAIAGETT